MEDVSGSIEPGWKLNLHLLRAFQINPQRKESIYVKAEQNPCYTGSFHGLVTNNIASKLCAIPLLGDVELSPLADEITELDNAK